MTLNDVSPNDAGFLLCAEDFKHVIEYAPLISIDLVVEDKAGRYLLGKRINAPAKVCPQRGLSKSLVGGGPRHSV